MPQTARIVGIPGAGKTSRAIELIDLVRQRGYSLDQIGFFTFTRAARREAAERACAAFGVPLESLERSGWFRTLHSSASRVLRNSRGSIVNFDQEWLKNALDEPRLAAADDLDDGGAWSSQWRGKCPAQIALSLWDVTRNRLGVLAATYKQWAERLNEFRLPIDLEDAVAIVQRYERAKKKDDRIDFCDLALQVAGVEMTVGGPLEATPRGEMPYLPVCIFDEAQDTSPLLDRVARRFSENSIWVYLFGDREQGIYTWAGADPNAFMRWRVEKQEYLGKTWRCARHIIDFGLRLIRESDDITFDLRHLMVEPRCEGGIIETGLEEHLPLHCKDATAPTLVLARTNQQLAAIQHLLTSARLPWRSTRSAARWPATASLKLCMAFDELAQGKIVDGEAFRRIVQAVPVRYLDRGTKSFYAPAASKDLVRDCRLGTLVGHGARAELVEMIQTRRWLELVDPLEAEAWQAREKWGGVAEEPAIQVSTIHGSKGMQAEQVILFSKITGAVQQNLRTEEGQREERRVWYVAATRARDKLVLMEGRGANYEGLYECM